MIDWLFLYNLNLSSDFLLLLDILHFSDIFIKKKDLYTIFTKKISQKNKLNSILI